MQRPKRGEIWVNLKYGTFYRIAAIGRHSETQEEMVAYIRKGAWHFRPLDLFLRKFVPKIEWLAAKNDASGYLNKMVE
jgi:hypothetical protein